MDVIRITFGSGKQALRACYCENPAEQLMVSSMVFRREAFLHSVLHVCSEKNPRPLALLSMPLENPLLETIEIRTPPQAWV
jgi:hypothetical protein